MTFEEETAELKRQLRELRDVLVGDAAAHCAGYVLVWLLLVLVGLTMVAFHGWGA